MIVFTKIREKLFGKSDFGSCVAKFKKSIDAGLLKIMSEDGNISVSSYRGGCNFEAVGLSRAIVSDYFPACPEYGIGIIGIEKKIKELHEKFNSNIFTLPIGVCTDIEKVVKTISIKVNSFIYYKRCG